jgi:hypothetical protein
VFSTVLAALVVMVSVVYLDCPRDLLVATLCFMGAGFLTVFILRHLIGG